LTVASLARAHPDAGDIAYGQGDFLAGEFQPGSFDLAQRLLPGVHYRRHLYWRYSLTWSKPA
jgi:hypothetical protein